MEENNNKNLSRRDFLRRLGMGAGAVMASSVMGPLRVLAQEEQKKVGEKCSMALGSRFRFWDLV